MAKKKRTTALFDVISQSKRYQRPAVANPSGGGSWWPFGRRKVTPLVSVAAIHSSVLPQADVSDGPEESQVAPRRVARCQPVMKIPAHREPTDRSPEVDDAVQLGYESGPARSAPLPTVEDPLHKSLHVAVDPERKVIAFRMNYTVAIVGGFALCVAVGLAVVVGQHIRGGDGTPLLTPSLQKIQSGPAHPEVLGTGKRTTVTAGYAGANTGGETSPPTSSQSRAPKPKLTFNEPRENHFTVVDGKRQIGLNYVVIQMYAASEEKMAQEAGEFLKQHGVPCSIEKGIKGWPPSAFVLMGTQGFDRISTKEFKEYLAQIEALSAQFTAPVKGANQGTPKPSYKAFQPSPKKWDKLG